MELSPSEQIELLSEDVQEILGKVPPWITRRGMTIISIIVICLIVGSIIFKYPDVISSSVEIISENPPVSIIAKTSGKINQLLVKNEELINEGAILAVLENSADYNDIIILEKKLSQLEMYLLSNGLTESKKNIHYLLLPSIIKESRQPYVLGSVQSSYAEFMRSYNELKDYLSINYNDKKILSIQTQLRDYEEYSRTIEDQTINQKKIVSLHYRRYQKDSLLRLQSEIPTAEFEKSQQNFLQVKNHYQYLLVNLTNTRMQINQLKYDLMELENQKQGDIASLMNTLLIGLDNLKSSVVLWKSKYLLSSPIEGKVAFTSYWSKNQYVTEGEQIFTIVPSKPHKIVGRLKFPIEGSGKIKKGQKVLIRLHNYPYAEFGLLEGKIKNILLIPITSEGSVYYMAEMSLGYPLITNYGKQLPFNQNMQGNGEIITENISVFERIVAPLKSAIVKTL